MRKSDREPQLEDSAASSPILEGRRSHSAVRGLNSNVLKRCARSVLGVMVRAETHPTTKDQKEPATILARKTKKHVVTWQEFREAVLFVLSTRAFAGLRAEYGRVGRGFSKSMGESASTEFVVGFAHMTPGNQWSSFHVEESTACTTARSWSERG